MRRPSPNPAKTRLFNLIGEIAYRSGVTGLVHRLNPRKDLLILTYHNIISPPFLKRIAGIEDFQEPFSRQMAYIARYMSPISEEQLLKYLVMGSADKGGLLPHNPVLVTFDDGYGDIYDAALPVMKKLGIPGLVFVTANCIGKNESIWPNRLYYYFDQTKIQSCIVPDFLQVQAGKSIGLESNHQRHRAALLCLNGLKLLPSKERKESMGKLALALDIDPSIDPWDKLPMLNWDQLRSLNKQGISVGSHGLSHEIMTRLTPEELISEVQGSKEMIERKLDSSVTGFAYPNGGRMDHDSKTARALKEAGYRYAMTFQPGVYSNKADPFQIPRWAFYDRGISAFALHLARLSLRS